MISFSFGAAAGPKKPGLMTMSFAPVSVTVGIGGSAAFVVARIRSGLPETISAITKALELRLELIALTRSSAVV